MNDLIVDLSNITTIQKASLERLRDLSVDCIGHSVYESLSNNENVSEINIGYGSLIVMVEDNSILYKFIPNSKLENTLKNVVQNNESPLTKRVEKTIIDKIEKTYKDLL